MSYQSQYATYEELIALAVTPAVANRWGSGVCTNLLKAASSFADSYIGAQFTLPLIVADPDTVPPIENGWDMALTMAVCNIAAYLGYVQFGFNPNGTADQLIEKRYENAVAWLEKIRDEEIFPTWTDSGLPDDVTATVAVSSDPERGWTHGDRLVYGDSFWVQ